MKTTKWFVFLFIIIRRKPVKSNIYLLLINLEESNCYRKKIIFAFKKERFWYVRLYVDTKLHLMVTEEANGEWDSWGWVEQVWKEDEENVLRSLIFGRGGWVLTIITVPAQRLFLFQQDLGKETNKGKKTERDSDGQRMREIRSKQ